jgi:hypothetical protein
LCLKRSPKNLILSKSAHIVVGNSKIPTIVFFLCTSFFYLLWTASSRV